MTTPLTLGLIGDHDGSMVAHRAIPRAVPLAAAASGLDVTLKWVGTETIDPGRLDLGDFDGLWSRAQG